MWLPSELTAFAQVVELGSFTAAARAVGVPKVAVSRAVQSLEKRVGTRLLTRTTRRVSLTDAGRALLPLAARVATETAAARRLMGSLTEDRRTLRVLADPAYGRLLLAPLLPRFMERFPDIPLEVEMAMTLPDGPGEHWDVLFQNGPPQREGLVGTPLGRPPMILCATPAYLKAHPKIAQPIDLAQHAVLVTGHELSELRLHRGRTQAQVALTPRLIVTDPAVVHAATAAGAGVGVLPEFLCRIGLSMNKLERVLPDWQVADLLELHAVSDLKRAGTPAVKSLVEFFIANMVPVLGHG